MTTPGPAFPAMLTSCAAADRDRVEAGIRACYRQIGRTPPVSVVWVRSPSEAVRYADPRRRWRELIRLTRPARWPEHRRRWVARCAALGAAAGALVGVHIAGLVAGAALGQLPLLLIYLAILAPATGIVVAASDELRDVLSGPPHLDVVRGRAVRILCRSVRYGLTVLVAGAGPVVIGMAFTLLWVLDQGSGDGIGSILLDWLVATVLAGVLGAAAGAVFGARRPPPEDLAEVGDQDRLDQRICALPDGGADQPSGSPAAAARSLGWHATGRDGRPAGPALDHLQQNALGLGRPLLRPAGEPPFRFAADLHRLAGQDRLAPADAERAAAYTEAGGAWQWWAFPGLAVACERPAALVVDPEPSGAAGLRLHAADGPAVRWRDGTVEHWWRGLPVPGDLVRGRWTVRRIVREPNSEVRRAAVERMGWPEFIRRARLRLVSTGPDPGNADRELRLYDLPAAFAGPGHRLLVMTNGSPDRSGNERHYAEPVPDFDDVVAAAAWQYGVPPETYRRLERRT